jgi:hypothetical protein
MVPAGYMAKKVESPPDWLKSEGLWDLYSVSGCISKYFCDYTPHWKHNGFWLFDSPAEITAVAAAEFLNMLDQTISTTRYTRTSSTMTERFGSPFRLINRSKPK